MIGGNLIRHVKTHNKLSKEMLSDVLQYQRKYESEKCDGVVIKELIQKHGINWEALPKKLVKSIMMKDSTTSVDGNLRTWQSKLEKNIVPSECEIIWVVGKSGNEGKTWFQQYLQNQYGSNRTFAAPIKNPLKAYYILSQSRYFLSSMCLCLTSQEVLVVWMFHMNYWRKLKMEMQYLQNMIVND